MHFYAYGVTVCVFVTVRLTGPAYPVLYLLLLSPMWCLVGVYRWVVCGKVGGGKGVTRQNDNHNKRESRNIF